MLVVRCRRRGRLVLLGLSSILTVHNTELGPIAVFRCSCDEIGLWHRGSSYAASAGFDPSSDPASAAEIIRQSRLTASSIGEGGRL